MERIYFSISRFINYIKENKPFKSYIEPLTLIHQTLINAFNNKQICISFNENKNRTVPKIKNGELAFLSIEMTQKEFEGKEYYPSRTGFTTNKALVKNILAKKLEEETEEEDYGFNCFKVHQNLNKLHNYFCSVCLPEHSGLKQKGLL